MNEVVRVRKTQQQRSGEMRGALLDAAVESLVELGFARTTTVEVQRRAGVSRGALLHHFPAKADLLVATIRHLATLRGRELKTLASRLPEGGERLDHVLALLWESFNGPLFRVSVELQTAARTDPDLRTHLLTAERELHQRIGTQSKYLFGPALASRPGFGNALEITLLLMTGTAMSTALRAEAKSPPGLLERWKFVFTQAINNPEMGTEIIDE